MRPPWRRRFWWRLLIAKRSEAMREDGRRRTAAMVASCAALIKAERILTSPFLRAADTAAIPRHVEHGTAGDAF